MNRIQVILGVVGGILLIAIIAYIANEEYQKQQWAERLSTGHTECQILRASGDEWIKCELEYIQEAREFCWKYPDFNRDMCVNLEKQIEESPELNKIFP
ncbi:hypothetical protein NKOR_03880 [Candidatus Nitrosopumilus koreensis AR1]|uniref:Uncharacterized protein n=1 Tax=Candidatus Nitrosopumilus koreensis AR1 TaxID=1229908 RepID=K0B861_9ARCH|nr:MULTISPECIES: hypothetical protein [Nitrosopumilus]AFS80666.1 hypothetical protein NKOR_03880 [Candidatus Nitrosopumilus koreensis AR1]